MDTETLATMESIVSGLVQMGALGIMLAYMMYKENKTIESHRKERQDWTQLSEKRNDDMKNVLDKNTTALNQHSATMDKLCDRIEKNTCEYRHTG